MGDTIFSIKHSEITGNQAGVIIKGTVTLSFFLVFQDIGFRIMRALLSMSERFLNFKLFDIVIID